MLSVIWVDVIVLDVVMQSLAVIITFMLSVILLDVIVLDVVMLGLTLMIP